MEKKTVAIIQARLTSTRLPGKVLKYIDPSTTVLASVIQRLKAAKLVDEVVVATTQDASDNALVEYCSAMGVPVYKGSRENVLERFFLCANAHKASNIVRVTSDNPLVSPDVIDQTIQQYQLEKSDYAANNLLKTFPHGMDVEVFSYSALEKAYHEATLSSDLEHVTQYIRHRPEIFSLSNLRYHGNAHQIRLTVDEADDLELIRLIVRLLGREASLVQITQLFDEFPGLFNINANAAERHAQYNTLQNVI